jgi:L-lactate dehydrogenase complex protein LldE
VVSHVTLFPTCLVDAIAPETGMSTARILQSIGDEVEVPEGATCCGQPAWNAGHPKPAATVARTTLQALSDTTGPIVVPSGSCATMITVFWPELFELAGSRSERTLAAEVAVRTVELSAYLTTRTRTVSHTDATPTVYHRSCHMLRELSITDEPERLLAGVATDVRPSEAQGRCCGFGGLFSVKLPEVSTAMADEVLDAVTATGATRVVGCDVSCLMHLAGRSSRRGLGLRFAHLAEVLDGSTSS